MLYLVKMGSSSMILSKDIYKIQKDGSWESDLLNVGDTFDILSKASSVVLDFISINPYI